MPPAFFGLISQADTTHGLDQASDSGVLGNPNLLATFADRITNDKTPDLYGAAEANAIVRIYLDTNGIPGLQSTGVNPDTYLGESVAVPLDGTNQFPNGEWTFHVTRDLNDPALGLGHDGLRTFFVTGEDLAGNVTADANADSLQIFIDTQGPQVTNVQITGSPSYNLFGLKAETITDTVAAGFSTTTFSGNTDCHVANRRIALLARQLLRRPHHHLHLGARRRPEGDSDRLRRRDAHLHGHTRAVEHPEPGRRASRFRATRAARSHPAGQFADDQLQDLPPRIAGLPLQRAGGRRNHGLAGDRSGQLPAGWRFQRRDPDPVGPVQSATRRWPVPPPPARSC